MTDTGGGKRGKKRGSDGTKARKRRSQPEHGVLGPRPGRAFYEKLKNTHADTHSYTHTHTQSKHRIIHKQKTALFYGTYIHTECTETVVKFNCENVESQENPRGAREGRNVLKLGHSLREERKCACA